MKVVAVVVAAGRGERLGEAGNDRPKALVELAPGTTLLEEALQRVIAAGVASTVVVHTPGHLDAFVAVASRFPSADIALVAGGATRAASVRAGVERVPHDVELVAIHDAARALMPPEVMRRTFAAVAGDVVAAAPATRVADTLKRATVTGEVHGTVTREGLWAVQTPQVVRADVLEAVLAWAGGRDTTDDLGLVENAIAARIVDGRIRLVRGDARGLKVTDPTDLEIARVIAASHDR